MSRDPRPLKMWMLANGYGDRETGVVNSDDCARFATEMSALTGREIAGETIRFIAHGYRPATWNQGFDIELFTVGGVCAHDLRLGAA